MASIEESIIILCVAIIVGYLLGELGKRRR